MNDATGGSAIEQHADGEILASGVEPTRYALGQSLLRFDHVVGGAERVTLVEQPKGGSAVARVRCSDGAERAVRMSYLYPETGLVREYIDASVELAALIAGRREVTAGSSDPRLEARRRARPLRERFSAAASDLDRLFAAPAVHPYPVRYRAAFAPPFGAGVDGPLRT